MKGLSPRVSNSVARVAFSTLLDYGCVFFTILDLDHAGIYNLL